MFFEMATERESAVNAAEPSRGDVFAMSVTHTLSNPRSLLAKAFARDWPLAFTGTLMLVTLLAALVGLVVDHRVITGAPAWMKPAKFAISIAIYCFTFIWLLSKIEGKRRAVRLVSAFTAIALSIEMVAIVIQVLRGTTSHFNVSTPVDTIIYRAMAFSIVIVWLACFVTAVLMTRQRLADPAFAWSLRIGVALSLVGMAVAFLMTMPTSAQLAAEHAGQTMPIAGAHSVGVPDGGPGIPILGWSTVGGDLRPAHFLGLHALQLMPLFGWFLSRRRTQLSTAARKALVAWVGLAYLGIIVILTWQALRSQPLIHPDSKTLAAIVVLLSGVALATLATMHLTRSRRMLITTGDTSLTS